MDKRVAIIILVLLVFPGFLTMFTNGESWGKSERIYVPGTNQYIQFDDNTTADYFEWRIVQMYNYTITIAYFNNVIDVNDNGPPLPVFGVGMDGGISGVDLTSFNWYNQTSLIVYSSVSDPLLIFIIVPEKPLTVKVSNANNAITINYANFRTNWDFFGYNVPDVYWNSTYNMLVIKFKATNYATITITYNGTSTTSITPSITTSTRSTTTSSSGFLNTTITIPIVNTKVNGTVFLIGIGVFLLLIILLLASSGNSVVIVKD